MIDYYARVAEAIVPHLQGPPADPEALPRRRRGLQLLREALPQAPPRLGQDRDRVLADRVGEIDFCPGRQQAHAGLAGAARRARAAPLARQGVQRSTVPTVLAFDLDPGPPATIIECCRIALRLRDLFAELGMECFPKTSGSKGMQVYVPLNEPASATTTTGPFAHAIALLLEKQSPKEVVSKMTKKLRKGKVFVDWSQNNRRQDDDRGLLAARQGAADRLHPARVGRGRVRRPLAQARAPRLHLGAGAEPHREARRPVRAGAEAAPEAARAARGPVNRRPRARVPSCR